MTPNPKALRARILLSGAMLLPVGIISVAVVMLFDNPKAEVDAVRKGFAAMSGVDLTYISDLEKQASQSITADIQVLGRGRMRFTGLEPTSFQRSPHIWLSGIGPFDFRTRGRIKGQEYYGYAIDIGPDSPIPEVRSLGITNVPAAIPRYGELLALMIHWPITENEWPSRWPVRSSEWLNASKDEIRFTGFGNEEIFYSLKRLHP